MNAVGLANMERKQDLIVLPIGKPFEARSIIALSMSLVPTDWMLIGI